MSTRQGSVATSAELPTYGQLFSVRGFPKLAASTVLARTAGQFWAVALVLFVLLRFHSPALAGLATFLNLAPGLCFSPLAGALLDRHGRHWLILLDYAIAACALTLLSVLSALGWLTPGLLLLVVSLGSLTAPLSFSGTRSLFPLVVPRTHWDRANAIDGGSFALALVAGPALAGFAVALLGGEGTFLAAAGVYVLAGVILIGFSDPASSRERHGPLLRSAWQAVGYVLRHPTLRGIMITFQASNIGFGIVAVALPVLVLQHFRWGAGGVGVLWSVSGVATVAAELLIGRFSTEGRERRIVAVGMAVSALALAMLIVPHVPAIALAMVLIGIAVAPVELGMIALRQRQTDPAWFGRVLSVSMSLNASGTPLGAALAGPLVERSLPLTLGLAVALALAGVFSALRLIPHEQARK
jgi:predicted MFS family arabinose efflux permease